MLYLPTRFCSAAALHLNQDGAVRQLIRVTGLAFWFGYILFKLLIHLIMIGIFALLAAVTLPISKAHNEIFGSADYCVRCDTTIGRIVD